MKQGVLLMFNLRHRLIPQFWPRILICWLFVCLAVPSASAQTSTIRYVNHAATGANNGTSWANAYTRLELALAAAQPNDQIWIAKGMYYPTTSSTNRLASFVLKDQVALYGGFAGTETTLNQRSSAVHRTILSGDIDKNDIHEDGIVTDTSNITGTNSYHVIFANNLSNGARIDGLYITAGWANGSSDDGYGAGILSIESKLTLHETYLLGNRAVNGGGLYLGRGQAIISSASMQNNEATQYGGAIYNDDAALEISTSNFEQNKATGTGVGGAIYTFDGSITGTSLKFHENSAASGGAIYSVASDITFDQSEFNRNTVLVNGGAIHSESSSLDLVMTQFEANRAAQHGGALHNSNFNITIMSDTNFSSNMAEHNGGAIYNLNSSISMTRAVGYKNRAINDGGFIYNSNATLQVHDSQVRSNEATYGGGIRNINNSTVTLHGTELLNNKATGGNGGAIASNDVTLNMINTIVRHNTTTNQGGGLWNNNGTLTLTNLQLTANTAAYGAGMYTMASTVTLTNATIADNSAAQAGGAMQHTNNSNVAVRNTVVWANTPSIVTAAGTTLNISYSMIEDCVLASWPTRCGTNGGNNLNPSNPQFELAPLNINTVGDYHLKLSPPSPLIDKGNNAFNSELQDISGGVRKYGASIDIGAYENQLYLLNITVEPAGKGSVSITPNQVIYNYNQSVTLTAHANPGWSLEMWDGDITPAYGISTTLVVKQVHNIVARFSNLAPTVNAGPDQVVTSNTLVTLNGSGSDADPSQTVSFKWSQIDGPTVTLSNPNIAQPTFTAPNSATTLTFSLVGTDNLGAVSSADTVIIKVQAPNQTTTYPIYLPLVRR
jgi:predicted outer membrane repeat protein